MINGQARPFIAYPSELFYNRIISSTASQYKIPVEFNAYIRANEHDLFEDGQTTMPYYSGGSSDEDE